MPTASSSIDTDSILENSETKIIKVSLSNPSKFDIKLGLSVEDSPFVPGELAENEIDWMNNSFHIKPPLGSERDRDFLQKALFKKSIKVLSSLHRPRSQAAKEGAFEGSVPGATSFETFLPLLLKLKKNLKISLVEAIDYITNQPSQVLGLNTGRISKNNPADICIFNPEHKWSSHPNTFQSTGKNSPFLNQDMTGKVTATISEGRIIFYDSKLIKITGKDIEKLFEKNTVKSEQAKY